MIFRDKQFNTLTTIVLCLSLAITTILIVVVRPASIISDFIALYIIISVICIVGVYITFYYFNGNKWSPRLVLLTGLTITTTIWLLISLFGYLHYGTRTLVENLLFYSYKVYMGGALTTAAVFFWLKTSYQHLKILSHKEEVMLRIVQRYEAYLKEKQETQQQNDTPLVKQSESKKLALALQHLFETEKIYRQQGLSVDDITRTLQTNSKYLSNAIKEHFQKGFVEYVNTYRVEEAIEMLKEQKKGEKYAHYSIEMIAEETGFGNRATFYTTFKRIVGVAPKEYMEMLRGEQERMCAGKEKNAETVMCEVVKLPKNTPSFVAISEFHNNTSSFQAS